MTLDEIFALRVARGWVSPLRPLGPGEGWCLADFVGGLYEFLVHPDEAAHCLVHGIRLDGVPLVEIHVVDEFPLLNGILLRARAPFEAPEGFVDASQTEQRDTLRAVA